MINGKRHQAILAAVMKLKRKHQELFWLHFRNGLTYEQIGLISKAKSKSRQGDVFSPLSENTF
jgi:DNA-directed RNA polymerase specialized sigma24 family protein